MSPLCYTVIHNLTLFFISFFERKFGCEFLKETLKKFDNNKNHGLRPAKNRNKKGTSFQISNGRNKELS